MEAKRLVDDILRPMIAVDGGVLELVSVSDDAMVIRLTGAYSGCPGRPYAMRIIERAAREALNPNIVVRLADD